MISWDELDIQSIHYKVYAYIYNNKGDIHINGKIIDDKSLDGYDSYSGGGMTFDYKSADTIRKYLQKKYNRAKSCINKSY